MNDPVNNDVRWRTIIRVLLPVYLLAYYYLLSAGDVGGVLIRLGYTGYLVLLVWITRRIASSTSGDEAEMPRSKGMIWIQIGLLGVVILLTGLSTIRIPLWSDMTAWFFELGEALLPAEWFGGPGNSIANPVQYFVIPFLLLLALGARPTELGFRKGNKVWQVGLVWVALPALVIAALLVTGSLTGQVVARRMIGNAFQNGFFEEFLFRGALLTRLRKVISVPWALAIQGLVFGLWHLRANTASMDGNLLAGLAVCIVSQTVIGVGYGYLFHKTKNLAAPSAAHVFMNVMGQSLG